MLRLEETQLSFEVFRDDRLVTACAKFGHRDLDDHIRKAFQELVQEGNELIERERCLLEILDGKAIMNGVWAPVGFRDVIIRDNGSILNFYTFDKNNPLDVPKKRI